MSDVEFEPAWCFKCSTRTVRVIPGVEYPEKNAECTTCGEKSYAYVVAAGPAPEPTV